MNRRRFLKMFGLGVAGAAVAPAAVAAVVKSVPVARPVITLHGLDQYGNEQTETLMTFRGPGATPEGWARFDATWRRTKEENQILEANRWLGVSLRKVLEETACELLR